MLGMGYRLAGEGQMKSAANQVINCHYYEKSSDDGEKIKVFHENHVPDASCETGSAFLRNRSENQTGR